MRAFDDKDFSYTTVNEMICRLSLFLLFVAAHAGGGEDAGVVDQSDVKAVGVLTGHKDAISAVAFSANGKIVATAGGDDCTVKLWDVANQKEMAEFKEKNPVSTITFSPDGKSIAIATYSLPSVNYVVKIFDVETRKETNTFDFGERTGISTIAFSSDGALMVIGGSRQSKLVVVPAGKMEIWNMAKGTRQASFAQDDPVSAAVFSRNGKELAIGMEDKFSGYKLQPHGRAKIIDIDSGTAKLEVKGHTGWVGSVAFSPDENSLIIGSKVVQIWDKPKNQERQNLKMESLGVGVLSFCANGTVLETADEETVKLWNFNTGALLATLNIRRCVGFSPDGTILAAKDWGHDVKLWDISKIISALKEKK